MKLDELIKQLKKENATLKAELARAIELKDGETYNWDLLGRVQERDAWRAEAMAARPYIAAMETEIERLHGNPPMMYGGKLSKLYDTYRDSGVKEIQTK